MLTQQDINKGVEILLLPKNIEFVERMLRIVTADHSYLFVHAGSCGVEIQGILWKDSLYIENTDGAIMVLKEAIRRYQKNLAV